MNRVKMRQVLFGLLAILLLFSCAASAGAEEWDSSDGTTDPNTEENSGMNTETNSENSSDTEAEPFVEEPIPDPYAEAGPFAYENPISETPYVVVPESTGYAVGAFDQQTQPSNGAVRADVLPFMLNDAAPDFSLQTTKGDYQGLGSYRGQYIIITFWTSWKDDCLSSLSALRSVSRKYPDFSIMAVNSLPAENNNAAWTEEAFMGHIAWINSYFDEKGLGYSALLDINGQVSSSFRANQLPTTYFIDRDGIIRISWPGTLTGDTLDTLLGMMTALDVF
ncbi:hypothetical protein FACS1894184_06540 [Clostridia bacterium]|nr:hypothetical protein FACS1894184_06540 [Clostridia bacterium]